LASSCPVSFRLFSQRLIEGIEIPKISATSALDIPRSTASSTFTLKSFEYARIPRSFAEDQLSRNPLSVDAGPARCPRGLNPVVGPTATVSISDLQGNILFSKQVPIT
jgi:hypothetical protein